MRAYVRLREVKRPISDDVIAYRLEATEPNEAGFKGKASYRAPFFIAQSTDNTASVIERGGLSKMLADFEEELRWRGYTDLIFGK